MRKNIPTTSFFSLDVVKYEQSGLLPHKLSGGEALSGWIIVGFFAAFGMVSLGMTLGCLLLFLRFRGRGGWMILTEKDALFEEYYRGLSSLGILKCRFLNLSSSELEDWLEEHFIERTGGEDAAQPENRS